MSETPEIPEAKDPFEKRAAVTIAIIAICLSFVGNLGENARTEAIIKTNNASDQWGYFQAKGIKGQISAMHADVLMNSATTGPGEADKKRKDAERYNEEKAELKVEAEKLQVEAKHESSINERCERASLFLQLSVVLCSVSILARSHKFWWAGMLLGAAGLVIGTTAYIM